ncbi:P-loop containing nucleoside triphosphate hydrolase protein [Hortaea werneckii]|nr:P-loop containing nucleoside triphosphate hydrolase protein [Hortaea werneckii]
MESTTPTSIPGSDELEFLQDTQPDTIGTYADQADLSDELAALQDLEQAAKRARSREVVQYRNWKTKDIFHSEPQDIGSSSPLRMPEMASSPPLTPSSQQKRKIGEVNLGENQLARPPKAQRTYYGINIHRLLEDAQAEDSIPKAALDLPTPPAEPATSKKSNLLWTEKYRARKFTDLIGDERTHRAVMHWLKRWDQIVFPGSYRAPKSKTKGPNELFEEKPHRKILMLTGPPGLGKTTLAHVCAKQAGYEVQEINASDERSGNVVKGRIRDMVGTENVKGVDTKKVDGKLRKAGRPVCVVVDEVDGVVGSGGGGEGGFVKALIDLVLLDQKNSSALGTMQQAPARKKKKGDRFRLLRPMILICNDVYHPSLRPLRQSGHAEIVHMRKPQLQTAAARLQNIFHREGVPADSDGVRRLCEAAWGVSNRKEDRTSSGAGEGDMRGIMVVGEWVAGKLRAMNESEGNMRLTRRWVEDHVLSDLAHGGGAARGLGRGGPKDIVERVFQEGAGFPKSTNTFTPQHPSSITGTKGVAESQKRTATDRLRQLIDTHGDTDRIVTDCFTSYPDHPFQDDTLLSKPDAAYEWLHFHDCLSSAVYSSSEWEMAPYLSTPVLGFHHLFASSMRSKQANAPLATEETEDELPTHPFAGPQASWAAHEATKHNHSLIESLHSGLGLELSRMFSSTHDIATDLLPYLLRMLSPNVNPVVVGGSGTEKGTASVRKSSEQQLVQRAVQAMGASGIRFERTKVTPDDVGGGKPSWQSAQWVYRMEPSVDVLGAFETAGKGFGEAGGSKQRYAVRQVLEQEWKKEEARRAEAARMARFKGDNPDQTPADAMVKSAVVGDEEAGHAAKVAVKRDFFGRPIAMPVGGPGAQQSKKGKGREDEEGRVWVTYHEGFSNAVRKPITLGELMRGL